MTELTINPDQTSPPTPPTAPSTPTTPSQPEPVSALESPSLAGAHEPKPAEPGVDWKALDVADLTLPSEIRPDDARLPEFIKDVNEARVPKGLAQKFLDKYSADIRAAAIAPVEVFRTMNERWQNEVRSDPDIGGDKLSKEVLPAVSRVIDRFGGDQLREALDFTGAGNHPAMVRAFYQIAKALNESTGAIVGGVPQPETNKTRPPPAQSLYGPAGPRGFTPPG
jgi:hypothetical protein